MRGTINLISRTIALIVVFTIGFATLAGFMVGGGYLALTKISIDALQELGLDINTDRFFDDEKAEVDISSLTLKDMLSEALRLSRLSDVLSIQYLIDRYGIKLEDKIPAFITQNYREMPIKELLSEETQEEFFNTTLLGDIYSYERVDNPDYNDELDEGNPYIWTDSNGVQLVGLAALMASYTIGEVLSISQDPAILTDGLAIAEILELTCISGLPIYIVGSSEPIDSAQLSAPINVWVDSNGNTANGILGAIAKFKIDEVESGMNTLTIGDLTSLVSYQDKWYMWSHDAENNCILLEEKNDVTSELAHVTIAEVSSGGLSDAVSDIKLSSVLGYTQGNDGKWYKDGVEVTGIMASVAPYKVNELDGKVGTIKIGEVAGYTYDDESGAWLDNGVPATGMLATLADLTVDEMSNEEKLSEKIQTVKVADIMGYKKNTDDVWCTEDSDGVLTPVTGIMGVIANSPINEAQAAVDGALMADILGFSPKLDSDGNPVLNSNGNIIYVDKDNNEPHILMQKIARTPFDEIATITDDLTVADIVSEEQRTGYMKLVPEDTTLDELPTAVNSVIQSKSLTDLIDAGVFEDFTEEQKEHIKASPFAEYSIPDVILLMTGAPM